MAEQRKYRRLQKIKRGKWGPKTPAIIVYAIGDVKDNKIKIFKIIT